MTTHTLRFIFEANAIKKKSPLSQGAPPQSEAANKNKWLDLPTLNKQLPLDVVPFPDPDGDSTVQEVVAKPPKEDPNWQSLYQKYQKLQLHYSVCQILLKVGLDLNLQLHEIARLLCNQFGLWQCHIFLQSEEDESDLICSASYNTQQKNLHTIQVDWLIRVGKEDPLGQAMHQKRDVLTYHKEYHRYCLPIAHQQDALGVIDLYYTLHHTPSVEEQLSLKTIAVQISSYLEEYKRYQKAQQMAITDGLTHLYNHRYFQESLEHVIRHAHKKKEWVSLIILDIDFFKKINDEFGHLQGDKVLTQVAHVIKKTIRHADIPARYGGEEFAILLKNTDLVVAKQVAERLRSNLEKEEIYDEGQRQIKVTASIGLAGFLAPEPQHKPRLLSLADEALYHIKNHGRNGVWVHPSLIQETPPPAQPAAVNTPPSLASDLRAYEALIQEQWLENIETYQDQGVKTVAEYVLPVFGYLIAKLSQCAERNKLFPVLELLDKLPKPPLLEPLSFEVAGMLLQDAIQSILCLEYKDSPDLIQFLEGLQLNLTHVMDTLSKYN